MDWWDWPLWRILNAFHWWFAGPDRNPDHRKKVEGILAAMTYRYEHGAEDPEYDPDAPEWWLGEDEASESTTILGARLAR